MSDDEQHITRRELGLVVAAVGEQIKALEARLTVKVVLAVVAGSAISKALGPVTAGAVAALGVAGWVVKVAVAALLHR